MSFCDQTVKSVDHSLALRAPNLVMRPRQIGAFYPTRLSFARTLLRQMVKEFWNIYPVCFDLDIYGVGTAIYRIDTQNQTVWFVAFANQINKEDRTDRVIAEKQLWECQNPDKSVEKEWFSAEELEKKYKDYKNQ